MRLQLKKLRTTIASQFPAARAYSCALKKGIKKFFLRYSVNGQRKTISLGSADSLSLADARDLANDLLKRIALGEDPAEEKRLARKKAAEDKKAINVFRCCHPMGCRKIIGDTTTKESPTLSVVYTTMFSHI